MNIENVHSDASHLEAIIHFVVRYNLQPHHHIGYFGASPADIEHTIRSLPSGPEERFVLAYEDNVLVGLLGIDDDLEVGRAWLLGPIIIHSDWQEIAGELYAAARALIQTGIREHELFCDAHNINCQTFAARHDFPMRGESAIYYITRDRFASLPPVTAQEWQPRYFDQLHTLHNQLFPSTYVTTQQMVDKRDEHTKLLIAAEGDTLRGYIFAKAEPESGEGYIDLIGVAEPYRRKGIGKKLIQAFLHWAASIPAIQQVILTVNADNTAAQQLYRALGFSQERIMRGYRKEIDN